MLAVMPSSSTVRFSDLQNNKLKKNILRNIYTSKSCPWIWTELLIYHKHVRLLGQWHFFSFPNMLGRLPGGNSPRCIWWRPDGLSSPLQTAQCTVTWDMTEHCAYVHIYIVSTFTYFLHDIEQDSRFLRIICVCVHKPPTRYTNFLKNLIKCFTWGF